MPPEERDGPALLSEFLEQHGISRRIAGSALGVSHVTVMAWERRQSTPEPPTREAIEVWSKGYVPRGSWPLSRNERRATENAVKVAPYDAVDRTGTEE